MLLVETYVDESEIDGIGLFSNQFIPADTKIWKLIEPFDVVVTKKQMDALPKPARSQVYNYCYRDKSDRFYVICGGDARFMNHSPTPTTYEDEDGDTAAAFDIYQHMELTCDYYGFDADARRKLGPKHKRTRRK